MSKRRSFLIPILAVLAAALAAFFFLSGNRESIKKSPEFSAAGPGETVGPASDGRPKRKVTLFFLRDDSESLIPEEREITAEPGAPTSEARSILLELIKGSSTGLLSPLPPETKLIQVYATRDGTLYADFSRELAERHSSGSSAEIATVYAIVDALAYNIRTVKKVFILVEGEEKETLAGHIILDRPILPDFSLIGKN